MTALWTDAPGAEEHVASLHQQRRISSVERDDLAHFIEHGWIIWRNAIEPEVIDALVADIASHHHHVGQFITTDHRRGNPKLKLSGSEPDRFESLFDLYVNFASSRAVAMHPRIARFLTLVFDAKPVMFQQLLFQRSNGHSVHQDTSVVAVEEPLQLAATWVALQDVIEGSGELAFYDRSHRLPHYLFKDGTKRMNFAVDDRQEYISELEAACRRNGMGYEVFRAKKGDVLIWAADLVHQSHPRTLPDGTNRLSCVTHYHPDTTIPFWFRFHPDHRTKLPVDNLGYYVSAHYRLDRAESGMLAPDSVALR